VPLALPVRLGPLVQLELLDPPDRKEQLGRQVQVAVVYPLACP